MLEKYLTSAAPQSGFAALSVSERADQLTELIITQDDDEQARAFIELLTIIEEMVTLDKDWESGIRFATTRAYSKTIHFDKAKREFTKGASDE